MGILQKINKEIRTNIIMIEIHIKNKYYGKKKVLENIDLSFSSGNIYGIVGRNGAGKTTLFRCIAGLETCDGSVNAPFENLKNHLGYLETDPAIMSFITGREHLQLMCNARDITTDDFEEQNVFDLPLDQYANTYSTGMKKKLALMSILLQKNDIVILDEPFNGVDIQSNILITEIIEELKRLGKAILISSHIFSSLNTICDKIILLDGGTVKKVATKEEYNDLESELKATIVGEKIKKIRL